MASVNKVILVGNLGADPEVRYSANQEALATFSMATTDTWKDRTSGEKREATEWHRIVTFGKLAEIVEKYLKKGRTVYVEGSIQTKKWQDKEGRDQYTTQIRATTVQLLGSPAGSGDGDSRSSQQPDRNYGNQRPANNDQRGSGRAPDQGNQRPAQGNQRPAPTPTPAPSSPGWDDDIPW